MKTNGRTDECKLFHVAVSVRIAARSLINMQRKVAGNSPPPLFSASALIIHLSICSQLFREAAVYSCLIPSPPSLTQRWPSRARRAGRRDRQRQSGTGVERWSWRGQKCRNVINNRQRQDLPGGNRWQKGREKTVKQRTQNARLQWEVGGIMGKRGSWWRTKTELVLPVKGSTASLSQVVLRFCRCPHLCKLSALLSPLWRSGIPLGRSDRWAMNCACLPVWPSL